MVADSQTDYTGVLVSSATQAIIRGADASNAPINVKLLGGGGETSDQFSC